jgi:hypothetical protein
VAWQKLPAPSPPRYQQANLELVRLQDAVKSDGGVVADDEGGVLALWASFFYQRGGGRPTESQFHSGIPATLIAETAIPLAQQLRDGGELALPVWALGADLEPISLASARQLGLRLDTAVDWTAGKHRTALTVTRVWGGTGAGGAAGLQSGDVLLSVGGCVRPRTLWVRQGREGWRRTPICDILV